MTKTTDRPVHSFRETAGAAHRAAKAAYVAAAEAAEACGKARTAAHAHPNATAAKIWGERAAMFRRMAEEARREMIRR